MKLGWKEISEIAKKKAPRRIGVVAPYKSEILEGLRLAEGLIEPVLIGDLKKIQELLLKFPLKEASVEEAGSTEEALERGIALAREGKVELLMKGSIGTPQFMKAVLDKNSGLRTGFFSHIAAHSIESYPKMLFITDAGLNPHPNLEEKTLILRNAIAYLKKLGIEQPKVACVTSVETVHPELPETIDAAAISLMAKRGQLGDVVVEGPLGLDMALSKKAAEIKGYRGVVPGETDILLVPNVSAGNLMSKAIIYLAGASVGGFVTGGKVPIVLLSRADHPTFKFNSIILALASL
jgi:phosphate butyryltransferase